MNNCSIPDPVESKEDSGNSVTLKYGFLTLRYGLAYVEVRVPYVEVRDFFLGSTSGEPQTGQRRWYGPRKHRRRRHKKEEYAFKSYSCKDSYFEVLPHHVAGNLWRSPGQTEAAAASRFISITSGRCSFGVRLP